MRHARTALTWVLLAALAAGCMPSLSPAGTRSPTPDESILYLNLVWHEHQPLYYKDESGIYTRPWARAHATKDYYDMAALVAQYPDVHVTFNLTPVLIRQLDDLANGAEDLYRVEAETPAADLTQDQKRFILERFFDANWDHMIARFPRYQALLDLRGKASDPGAIEAALQRFTPQDFLDLQIWWNLAWFDPSFLAEPPLEDLVSRGSGFSESDKQALFEQVDKVVSQVIPIYRQLQDEGRIEVSVTPYAHPILPLLYATDLASKGDPGATLPPRFSFPNDAIAQVEKGVAVYEAHFGQAPRGLWPAEGAVAQEIVKFVADAGFTWMASGEQVLARSLGREAFTRDSLDTVKEADDLYRPYYVQFRDGPKVAVVFRDVRLSDMIGFEYSGDPAEEAARDFMSRLDAIQGRLEAEGASGPHLVSVILDGENAWENYDNDGIDFLNALYRRLSESKTVRTVTPSQYLTMFPEQRSIEQLWPGAWFSSDFSTWIGEPEENQAWIDLASTRKALSAFDMTGKKTTDPANLAKALDNMFLAEGSDWFWWYGSDQDSGDDAYFDRAFRALLRGVYTSLGEPVPDFVDVPIIPESPAQADHPPAAVATPAIDGRAAEGEWDSAGVYLVRGGVQGRADRPIEALWLGYDQDNLYLRLDPRAVWSDSGPGTLEIYLSRENQPAASAFDRAHETLLGFGAGIVAIIDLDGGDVTGVRASRADTSGSWSSPGPWDGLLAVSGDTLEVALPYSLIDDPVPGEVVNARVLWSPSDGSGPSAGQTVPSQGPARIILPDLSGVTYFLTVDDPTGDDHGPGSYTYPTDPVFEPGVYDIKTFRVGVDGDEFVFRFDLNGLVHNPWGSGLGLSVQTFDVYVDFDPDAGTGARQLLEGRNAALGSDYGWDMAVWAEGWQQKVFIPGSDGAPQEVTGDNVRVIVDPAGSVTLRVRAAGIEGLGATAEGDWSLDPTGFGYLAVVLSQEGYPSPGVRRVRDVEPTAQQWRIGGGSGATNGTRIMDLAWPVDSGISQETMLSNYVASELSVGQMGPDDFPQVRLVVP